jgi:hypothetical protein
MRSTFLGFAVLAMVSCNAFAELPDAIHAPSVLDSNNTFVGNVSGSNGGLLGDAEILLQWRGRLVPVHVDATGFLLSGSLYFESIDCSGPAFAIETAHPSAATNALVLTSAVVAPGRSIFVRLPTVAAVSNFAPHSRRTGNTCANVAGTLPSVVQMARLGNLATLFVAPFHLGP